MWSAHATDILGSLFVRRAGDPAGFDDTRSVLRNRLLSLAIILAFTCAFAPVIGVRVLEWTRLRPQFALDRSGVTVAPDGSLRIEIAPAILRDAERRGANQLLLGRLPAHYRVLMEGELVAEGFGAGDPLPAAVAVPYPRLIAEKALTLSIELAGRRAVPELLGHEAGFYSQFALNQYKAATAFARITRPFALGLVYTLLSVLFFYFWATSPREEEYLYLSVYLLLTALIQLRDLDTLIAAVSTGPQLVTGFVLSSYRAAFGLLLGFAFARLRPAVFALSLPLLLLVPIALLPALNNPEAATVFIERWLNPAAHALGAVACLIQALYLLSLRRSGSYMPTRIRRLFLYTIGMVALGMLTWHAASDQLALGRGFETLVLTLVMGVLAAGEYRQQALLTTRTPVSEYHLRKPLPSEVRGLLLVIDLKCSEPFYRQRASSGESENLVALWRTHVYAAVARHGGVVLHKKGDEVAVLFDELARRDPLADAVQASRDIATVSRRLETDLAKRGLLPADAKGFHFRGAIARAAVVPVWEQLGSGREPGWEEASASRHSDVIGRLFQEERQLAGKRPLSLVLVAEDLRTPEHQGVIEVEAA